MERTMADWNSQREQVFLERYALRDEDGNLLERSCQDMWDRLARCLASSPEEYEIFRDALYDFKFVPGGRILSAAGSGKMATYYNCFTLGLEPRNPQSGRDSRDAIMNTLTDLVEITARGGGVGVNWSVLRPKGSYIHGVHGRSSGPNNWMLGADELADQINQGGNRAAALMFLLEDWHPNLPQFVSSGRTFRRANFSVGISHRFMKALEGDEDWVFVFPDTTHPDYNARWDGDILAWVEAGLPILEHGHAPAKEIWRMMCESTHHHGSPGVVFLDRCNEMSNTHYLERISCVNPCVAGDTRISTQDGLHMVKELWQRQDKQVSVLVDGRLSLETRFRGNSKVVRSGRKMVWRLVTKEGYEVSLTRDHRVMTTRGWVPAGGLRKGDEIHVVDRPGGFGTCGSLDLGRVLGWLAGDGYISGSRAALLFYGEDQDVGSDMVDSVNNIVEPPRYKGDRRARLHASPDGWSLIRSARLYKLAEKHGMLRRRTSVPDAIMRGSRDAQVGFLQSIFSADGHVDLHLKQRNSIRLTSSDRGLLREVQLLLLNFGILSTIYDDRKPAGWRDLPDGRGGSRSYPVKASHDLVISRDGISLFHQEIGFLQRSKSERLQAVLSGYTKGPYVRRPLVRFLELIPLAEEDVFDLTEPHTHSFIANGIVVHNCGEIPAPPNGSCNLGSINLPAFFEDGGLDRRRLAEVIRAAVRFLDRVIDVSPDVNERIGGVQRQTRRVGLGTMGLADLLILERIRYGSEESLRYISSLFSLIRDEAYLASIRLAREKGRAPALEVDPYLAGGFAAGLPEDIREYIRQHGIRNLVLLAQAPTGTTSIVAGVSSGIEPIYSRAYTRRDITGEHRMIHPLFCGEDADYLVTARDISVEGHIAVQATIQRFVDNSISKTINLPTDASVEDIGRAYLLAYQMGCKGVTVYRSGSLEDVLLEDDAVCQSCSI